MYSNDDDRRRDEQRRWEEQQYREQQRRDDEAAYARRQQEQRNHAEFYARREAQAQEWEAEKQQNRADNERRDQDWNDWRKQQAGQGGYAAHAPSYAQPEPQSFPLQAAAAPDGNGLVGLVAFALLLAVAFAVPALVFLALYELLYRFPLYALDPSFAGKVARAFVQALGSEWMQTLYQFIHTSVRRRAYGPLFLYGAGVWGVVLIGVPLVLGLTYRIHVAVGRIAVLALITVVGLFVYVLAHFS